MNDWFLILLLPLLIYITKKKKKKRVNAVYQHLPQILFCNTCKTLRIISYFQNPGCEFILILRDLVIW